MPVLQETLLLALAVAVLESFLALIVGHYVPQLANLIYEGNKRAHKDSYVNFKGFMVLSLPASFLSSARPLLFFFFK